MVVKGLKRCDDVDADDVEEEKVEGDWSEFRTNVEYASQRAAAISRQSPPIVGCDHSFARFRILQFGDGDLDLDLDCDGELGARGYYLVGKRREVVRFYYVTS